MERRAFLASAAGAMTIAAGCTSSSGSGSGSNSNRSNSTVGNQGKNGIQKSFTFAGYYFAETNRIGGLQPNGFPNLVNRIQKASGGSLSVNEVAKGELCSEQGCVQKVRTGSIEVGTSGIGNASENHPVLDSFILPYLFPTGVPNGFWGQAHAMTREKLWNSFWLPFAQQSGLIPIYFGPPSRNELMIGVEHMKGKDAENFRRPTAIKGLDFRRTLGRPQAIAINQWGANPVDMPFQDAVQGLKSGVVQGIETFTPAVYAYGIENSIDTLIGNQFGGSFFVVFANAEWLKGLSSEHREVLAKQSRRTFKDVVSDVGNAWLTRIGYQNNPPADSAVERNGHKMLVLAEEDLARWREPVDVMKNPELYDEVITDLEELTGESGYHKKIHSMARGNSVPEGPDKLRIEGWWDQIIEEV